MSTAGKIKTMAGELEKQWLSEAAAHTIAAVLIRLDEKVMELQDRLDGRR